MARTSRRQRELARARFERRQAQAARRAEQHRLRNTRLAAVVSLVVVVGLVIAVTLTSPGVEGETTAAIGATESAATDAGSPTGATATSDEPTPGTSPDASPDAGAAPSLDPQAAAAAAAAGLDCAPLPSRVTRTPVPIPSPQMQIERTSSYRAQITTNCGPIEIELLADDAPTAVNSFVFLARTGYYDNTLCHRLTTADERLSVLQCGDPTGTGAGGPGYQFSVENAPPDGQYPAGTLAMARAASPDSNGSQFFLTYADSTISTPDGYTVFGRVREGLDLLRKIGAAGVDPDNPPRPRVPIAITSVKVTAEVEQ